MEMIIALAFSDVSRSVTWLEHGIAHGNQNINAGRSSCFYYHHIKLLPERVTGYFRAYCKISRLIPRILGPPAQRNWCISTSQGLSCSLAPLRLNCFLDVRIATDAGTSSIHGLSSAHTEHLCDCRSFSFFLDWDTVHTHKIHPFKVCSSLEFSIVLILGDCHQHLIPEHIHHPPKSQAHY